MFSCEARPRDTAEQPNKYVAHHESVYLPPFALLIISSTPTGSASPSPPFETTQQTSSSR